MPPEPVSDLPGQALAPGLRKTAVVIPYYQEEPGILRGAVSSAIAQEGVSELEIIIVDDGSPAPALDDLKGLHIPAHITLKIMEQPNRGPGAARNRALDSVSPDTVYLALLDSDDRWTKSHLRNAHSILETGYDVYFADLAYWRSDDTVSYRTGLDPLRHILIDAQDRYFKFLGDARRQALNSINPFHTSCVVYRWGKFKALRYHEVAFMGEDLTFWMELAGQTDQIAFHADVECFSTRGIHIYENSGWATPRAIWRIYHYMKWRKWLSRPTLRNDLEVRENAKEIKKLRRAFAAALLHEIRKGRAFTNPDVARFFICDPMIFLYIVPLTVELIAEKVGLGRWGTE